MVTDHLNRNRQRAKWKEGRLLRAGGSGSGDLSPSSVMDMLKLYVTNVEVLDPKERSLVTQFSMKQHVISFLPDRRAAIYSEDADGFARLEIVQFLLCGR